MGAKSLLSQYTYILCQRLKKRGTKSIATRAWEVTKGGNWRFLTGFFGSFLAHLRHQAITIVW